MKRNLAIILALLLCVCVSACTDSVNSADISSSQAQSEVSISRIVLSEDDESIIKTSKFEESEECSSESGSSAPQKSIKTESKNESSEQSVTQPLEDVVLHTLSDIEHQIFDLVNKERVEAGLSEYRLDLGIYEQAKIRATEAADTWSHTRPDGRDYWSVFTDFDIYDYSVVGENLGRKFSSAERIVEALMNSEGHRANILSERFDVVCIAVYTTPDGMNCLCQLFGKTR